MNYILMHIQKWHPLKNSAVNIHVGHPVYIIARRSETSSESALWTLRSAVELNHHPVPLYLSLWPMPETTQTQKHALPDHTETAMGSCTQTALELSVLCSVWVFVYESERL